MKAGIKNSLFDALFETFIKDEKLNKFEKLPFEIINIGGDDISLIVAGPFCNTRPRKFKGSPGGSFIVKAQRPLDLLNFPRHQFLYFGVIYKIKKEQLIF